MACCYCHGGEVDENPVRITALLLKRHEVLKRDELLSAATTAKGDPDG